MISKFPKSKKLLAVQCPRMAAGSFIYMFNMEDKYKDYGFFFSFRENAHRLKDQKLVFGTNYS